MAYRKAYREENRARLSAVESEWKKADRKKNPERWRKKYREKYRRQQMKIHGDGWKPRKRLTAVERSENRNAAARKKYRRWREIHPEQYLAKLAVKAALKVGRLVKQPCSVCGDPKGQAHHPDYSAPLEVVWLCDAHHRQAHRESKK